MTQRETGAVAVITAHPDDEVLGFGGVIARHVQRGADVRILILATGLASRGTAEAQQLAELQEQGRRAAAILGARIEFADFPDNRMDSVPLLDVVQRVEAFLAGFAPVRVYTHHAGDLNIDHRVAQSAVLTACRPLPGATVRTVLAGEVNSATDWAGPGAMPFMPTEYCDISSTLELKLKAMACYAGELRDWPHARSLDGIRAQARFRGAQAGLEAAEAFVTLRRLD
jgi:LmbE family N-acetylglucosaminyl deacetylase